MESCDNCLFYKKEYEDFRKMFDDTMIVGDSDDGRRFCNMFDDSIPTEICSDGMKCPYFIEK